MVEVRVAQFFEYTIYYWIPHFIIVNLILYLFSLQRTIKITGFRSNVCTYTFSRPVTFIVLYIICTFEYLKFYFYFVCWERERRLGWIWMCLCHGRGQRRELRSLSSSTWLRQVFFCCFCHVMCSRLVVPQTSGQFSCLWL